jgi:predicted nucleic acid-binding protein
MIKKYILDTNILTYLYQKSASPHALVRNNFINLPYDSAVFVSVLSIYEIDYGVAVTENQKNILMFKNIKRLAEQPG